MNKILKVINSKEYDITMLAFITIAYLFNIVILGRALKTDKKFKDIK